MRLNGYSPSNQDRPAESKARTRSSFFTGVEDQPAPGAEPYVLAAVEPTKSAGQRHL